MADIFRRHFEMLFLNRNIWNFDLNFTEGATVKKSIIGSGNNLVLPGHHAITRNNDNPNSLTHICPTLPQYVNEYNINIWNVSTK